MMKYKSSMDLIIFTVYDKAKANYTHDVWMNNLCRLNLPYDMMIREMKTGKNHVYGNGR